MTLTLGNYLNHGNKRLGEASGFRLKALNKTADTRSVDGKSTLMQVRAGVREQDSYPCRREATSTADSCSTRWWWVRVLEAWAGMGHCRHFVDRLCNRQSNSKLAVLLDARTVGLCAVLCIKQCQGLHQTCQAAASHALVTLPLSHLQQPTANHTLHWPVREARDADIQ